MGEFTNSNEVVEDGAEGHDHGGSTTNEPVAGDDVEGHALTTNANEPVDEDDVEGHGLLRNAAIAAALTVGGGVAMASPASAGPVGDATTIVNNAATPEAVSAFILETYGRSVPPENLQAIWDRLPAGLRATGSVEQIGTYIVELVPPDPNLEAILSDPNLEAILSDPNLEAVPPDPNLEALAGNTGPIVGNQVTGPFSGDPVADGTGSVAEVLGGPRSVGGTEDHDPCSE